jgi:hypothetical protein
LAEAGEVVLDHEGAVVTEPFGLDVVVDEILEAPRAIHIHAAALRLGAAKKAKFHGFDPTARLFFVTSTVTVTLIVTYCSCHLLRCVITPHSDPGWPLSRLVFAAYSVGINYVITNRFKRGAPSEATAAR